MCGAVATDMRLKMKDLQRQEAAGARDDEERALLDRIGAGDRVAITELYARYHARLFKFVYRITRSHSASDETVNDIMLAVWRGARNFRGDSKPSTWIFGIAYRQCLKRLSRRQLSILPTDPDALGDGATGQLEHEDWVRKGIESLPAAQRLTVLLVFYAGLSYDEVAAATDCPVNTVKTRMYHARRKLKARLRESAGAQAPGGKLE